jgi:hypothetical protein
MNAPGDHFPFPSSFKKPVHGIFATAASFAAAGVKVPPHKKPG